MKQLITTLVLLATTVTFSQEATPYPKLLNTPADWKNEFFTIPLSFAQELPLQGFEEAVFPPGWSDVESEALWSYAFAWHVSAQQPLSTLDLEAYLQQYFDGLMQVELVQKEDPNVSPTNVLLLKQATQNNSTHYIGKVKTYDRFRSQKMVTLHLELEQYYCPKEKKSVTVFRFSPKERHETVWDMLRSVILLDGYCTIEK